nr:tyrosine-protein phosphatase [Microbacterium murale]
MDEPVNRLDLAGTHNFREVAPGVLAPGMLYRSDALHRLTREGRRKLGEFGIRRVIDLRSTFDRRIGGRDRLRGTGATRLAVPIDGAPRAFDPRTLTLQEIYETVLSRHQSDLGRVIRAVASADGPVLVHCTAGKDRTGLVVALILSALEIDRDIILADYSATAANLSGDGADAAQDPALPRADDGQPDGGADGIPGRGIERHVRLARPRTRWGPGLPAEGGRRRCRARSAARGAASPHRLTRSGLRRSPHRAFADSGATARPARAAGCCRPRWRP